MSNVASPKPLTVTFTEMEAKHFRDNLTKFADQLRECSGLPKEERYKALKKLFAVSAANTVSLEGLMHASDHTNDMDFVEKVDTLAEKLVEQAEKIYSSKTLSEEDVRVTSQTKSAPKGFFNSSGRGEA